MNEVSFKFLAQEVLDLEAPMFTKKVSRGENSGSKIFQCQFPVNWPHQSVSDFTQNSCACTKIVGLVLTCI